MSEGAAVQVIREKLAENLGLAPHLLTSELLAKIADDELFLYHLTVAKGHPQIQQILLREVQPQDRSPTERSTFELLGRATAALARWAGSGFGRVEPDTYKRRLATCLACEHLSAPPAKMLYRFMRASDQEKTICGLCGCDVRRKAWLSSEDCPDRRWAGS